MDTRSLRKCHQSRDEQLCTAQCLFQAFSCLHSTIYPFVSIVIPSSATSDVSIRANRVRHDLNLKVCHSAQALSESHDDGNAQCR